MTLRAVARSGMATSLPNTTCSWACGIVLCRLSACPADGQTNR
jgi:hypothetical protein